MSGRGSPEPATRHVPIDRVLRPFHQFARAEASGALLLILCTGVALAWANSPWASSYFHLWEIHLGVTIGDFRLDKSLHHWINDGLMALFFFVVGLEIKREVLVGELSSFRQAAFPIFAALGGVLVPIAIYAFLNAGGEGARGWGIPMATDIAFALGILTLVGGPTSLKVFLAALAIADDIAAVLAIAAFYSASIGVGALAAGGVFLLALLVANRSGLRHPIPYALLGLCVWYGFLEAGVHPTTAGVLVAMTIPARSRIDAATFHARARPLVEAFAPSESERGASGRAGLSMIERREAEAAGALETALEQVQTPLQRLEHQLHPWVSYFVIPLFALANAGVVLGGEAVDLLHPVTLGILGGLVLGKPIGVTTFAWLAVRLGLGSKPADITWRQIHGAGWLAGIGFTMSLFIANLGFGRGPLLELAKIGVLAASALAALIGVLVLHSAAPETAEEELHGSP